MPTGQVSVTVVALGTGDERPVTTRVVEPPSPDRLRGTDRLRNTSPRHPRPVGTLSRLPYPRGDCGRRSTAARLDPRREGREGQSLLEVPAPRPTGHRLGPSEPPVAATRTTGSLGRGGGPRVPPALRQIPLQGVVRKENPPVARDLVRPYTTGEGTGGLGRRPPPRPGDPLKDVTSEVG